MEQTIHSHIQLFIQELYFKQFVKPIDWNDLSFLQNVQHFFLLLLYNASYIIESNFNNIIFFLYFYHNISFILLHINLHIIKLNHIQDMDLD